MTTYQKIAALIFRLVSVGLIIYACLVTASAALIGQPRVAWMFLPILICGVILHFAAIPLAWLVTRGFDE